MLVAYLLNAGSELFGKKWRSAIIYSLRSGPKRFSEIKKDIPECSVKVLSEALNEMEETGLLIRTQLPGKPVKVIYELTPDLHPFLHILDTYYKALLHFFSKNHSRFNFNPDVVELLKKQKVSGQ